MKKILVLTTGGTISSINSENGLIPSDATSYIVGALNTKDVIIESKKIMVVDSSNMQPEEWKIIAKEVFDGIQTHDGIIITHGTDTMAYTASMLSFMILNPSIPIVLTGSQLPLNHPLTDAVDNLRASLEMCKSGTKGIFIAFDRKIMLGCRAVKVRTSSFDAFESINMRLIAKITSLGIEFKDNRLMEYNNPPILNLNIDTNVFLLKLTPNLDPKILDIIVDSGIKGIVIEGYGAGGIPYIRRDFTDSIAKIVKQGIPVIVSSQCLYEKSHFNTYEVGLRVLQSGAIEATDMTTESIVCKLMYALGQTSDLEKIKEIFLTPIANEIFAL